jgi:hypothetical protein
MDYQAQYYKNLCEQLQGRINLLEAGLKKALSTGNPALMQQELAKRKARLQYYRDEQTRFNEMPNHIGASEANAKFAQAEALKPGILDLDMPLSSMGIKTGVKQSDLPSEKPWDLGADAFDTSDPGEKGSSEEVVAAQTKNAYTGNLQRPFPSPSDMASFKMRTGRPFNQY